MVQRIFIKIFIGIILFIVIAVNSSSVSAQKYFQQEVKYIIHISLNDHNHTLRGTENIVYINNSPDTLAFLYFHLWPNAYKNNETALAKQLLEDNNTIMYFSPDSCFGYIDSLDFQCNNESIKWEFDSNNIDICKLHLKNALKPGDSINIFTPFHVKIPDSRISRLGHEGQSYQITQWFPKPAVYDANGWNMMPYLNQGEFYSEFGSFDVYITLPANYVVGATGDLVNCEEEENWLEQKSEQTKNIKTYNFFDNKFPASSKELKTLHYFQNNIHDFAWFADKRYHVLKGEVALPVSGRTVNTWVMFTNKNANQWKDALEYVNDAVYYYSKWNGEYPFNQATAVEGALSAGGGMEYPNITVISSTGDSLSLEMVIMHEVGHNWFYGILGSNERKNPWMDEGINSFYDYRYLQTKYPGSTLFVGKLNNILKLPKHIERIERELLYQIAARSGNDQSPSLPSEDFTQMNYGGIVYEKVAVSFYSLMEYLGESKFDSIMKIYYETWKFKHPQPENLQGIFKTNSTKNTDWFFNDLLITTGTIDYKANHLFKTKTDIGNVNNIVISNKGSIPAPFQVALYKDSVMVFTKWCEGFVGKKNIIIGVQDFNQIKINPENNFPEISRKNNSLHKGMFSKIEPLRIQPIINFEDPDHTQLFYSPVFGYNKYNGFMAGVAAYNGFLPAKKFQYYLIPMYGVADKKLTGIAHLDYSIYFKNFIAQKININAGASTFSYSENPQQLSFYRNYAGIDIDFRKKNKRNTVSKTLSYKHYLIYKDIVTYTNNGIENIAVKENKSYEINYLKFEIADKRAINAYSTSISTEQNKDFIKCYAVYSQRINYSKPRKFLDIRLFAGSFLYSENNSLYDYRFHLSGVSGIKDYTFSSYFMGRSEGSGILSQQFIENDGAFKTPTFLGQTQDWLVALNLKSTIPGILPLKIFMDLGTYKDAGNGGNGGALLMDAGIQISLINNFFDIYIPLLYSDAIKANYQLNKTTFAEKIRFTLNLEKLNPFSLVKSIKL